MVWTTRGPRPAYCPTCGDGLGSTVVDGSSVPYCEACERRFFRNPVPLARVAVVDGASVLLIERGAGADIGAWALPGGHVDANESLSNAAARELEEETGVRVAPDALSLLGTGYLEFDDGHSLVSINYAVAREATTGEIVVGGDAADARFVAREAIVDDPPRVRASGPKQLLRAIDEHGSVGPA
ncbi:NUDIX hydrolase [Halovivax limisalsi]|uniref:NUDIX hydrolase n=1 Tax=Halovivax limisalsi TaxID=1453760 RepID=UPI001FFC7BFA|nr:NUDIX hydrolase [Halovivax limisalsi]